MNIQAWGAIVDNCENIWIPINNSKSLIKGKEYDDFKYIGKLETKDDKNVKIVKVLETDNSIILFSRFRYEAWIVDKKSYSIRNVLYYGDSSSVIMDIVNSGKHAVILSYSLENPILVLDLSDFKIDVLEISRKKNQTPPNCIRGVEKNNIVFTSNRELDNMEIYSINLGTKIVETIKIDLSLINAMNYEGDNWYLFALTKNNKTVLRRYDLDFGKLIEEYSLDDIEPIQRTGIIRYFRIEVYKEKVFFIPSMADKIYVYNTVAKTGKFLNYPDDVEYKPLLENECSFCEMQRKNGIVYLFPWRFNSVLKLDLQNEQINSIRVKHDISRQELTEGFDLKEIMKENAPVLFSEFLDTVMGYE